MEKDKYYLEACDDAREMQAHGYHWTDEIVEKRAAKLRIDWSQFSDAEDPTDEGRAECD